MHYTFLMKKITTGIIADVDAGKTTLSEAMLYLSGSIRSFGRVDKGDSFLDSNELERKRGITIFSKQARLSYQNTDLVLIDTPGHADFSAETERTLSVLDYALLVISAPEGEKGQTRLLRRLLREYHVPVFVFFNKMDQVMKNEGSFSLEDPEGKAVFAEKKEQLIRAFNRSSEDTAVDFSKILSRGENEGLESERLAECSEAAMEEYFRDGRVSDRTVRKMIKDGDLTPCVFGSAAKKEGVEDLLKMLDRYTLPSEYPAEFSAKIYKIARDPDGTRLTFVKITGGSIRVRDSVKDAGTDQRITQIRFYSGDRFTPAQSASAGDICALVGLKECRAGEILGKEDRTQTPVLTPVLGYRVLTGKDPMEVLPLFRILEEENPELSVTWEESRKEICIHVMGTVQLEILTSILKERFSLDASFDSGEVLYKETIASPVIGAGHFEPLRHYAEVHLMMEPLERGAGLVFESALSSDRLAKNWQRLILTHLSEKRHLGVLTGSPITDMKITLVAGRAHLKHTEGGDFRQATYRAVRQGLMMAENILLEPFYRFSIEIPTENVGRVMLDLDRMKAQFQPPDLGEEEGMSVVEGTGPVAALKDYPAVLSSYTGNRGRIRFMPDGYGECHNAAEVIEKKGYDPQSDRRNSPDSVFCEGGSGVIVPYDEVYDRLDIDLDDRESVLSGKTKQSAAVTGGPDEILLSEKEIDSIISAYSAANRKKRKSLKKRTAAPPVSRAASGRMLQFFPFEEADCLLVDGYNVIFAWEDLKDLAKDNIDAARDALIDHLSKYSAMVRSEVIVVFDAYKVRGKSREETRMNDVRIVFTKEDETADQYIEKFAGGEGKKRRIAVVTSDAAEQQITGGQGGMILSSREFKVRFEKMTEKWNKDYGIR